MTPLKQQARNKQQQTVVKTAGGRGRYWACQKTQYKQQHYGRWAYAPSRGTMNGRPL